MGTQTRFERDAEDLMMSHESASMLSSNIASEVLHELTDSTLLPHAHDASAHRIYIA